MMQLMRAILIRLLSLALLPAGLAAQPGGAGERADYFSGFIGSHINAQTIPGTQVTLSRGSASGGWLGFGFRATRLGAGSIWIEFPLAFLSQSPNTPLPPNSLDLEAEILAPGLRYMVPLKTFPRIASRIAVYGAAGGGLGFFNYPYVTAGPSPEVFVNSTAHGVVDFGGGVDVRVFGGAGARVEVRDFVTGRGLNGVSGRHHFVPSIGVVFHL